MIDECKKHVNTEAVRLFRLVTEKLYHPKGLSEDEKV